MAEDPKGNDRTTALIKTLAWPAIALVALIMFGTTLKGMLVNGQVGKVKVGLLELNFREGALPKVNDQKVATGLAGLPEQAVVALLFTQQDRPYSQCQGDHQSQADFDREYLQPFKVLEGRGLATLEAPLQDSEKCFTVALTKQGTNSREFLISLLAAQLKAD
jgi:hypothetical protein